MKNKIEEQHLIKEKNEEQQPKIEEQKTKNNRKSKSKIEQHKNEEQKQTQNPHEQKQKHNSDPKIQPRSKHSHEKNQRKYNPDQSIQNSILGRFFKRFKIREKISVLFECMRKKGSSFYK